MVSQFTIVSLWLASLCLPLWWNGTIHIIIERFRMRAISKFAAQLVLYVRKQPANLYFLLFAVNRLHYLYHMHWVFWISALNLRQLFNIPPCDSIEMECFNFYLIKSSRHDNSVHSLENAPIKFQFPRQIANVQSMCHKILHMLWIKHQKL